MLNETPDQKNTLLEISKVTERAKHLTQCFALEFFNADMTLKLEMKRSVKPTPYNHQTAKDISETDKACPDHLLIR